MIKATFKRDGVDGILLGLSHANLDRLRADGLTGYIEIKGAELGISVNIIITAAESEEMMLEAFAAGIKAGTELRISGKLKQ